MTTPHTILIPTEYQINTPSQNNFIACSLDGRLWLFEDYCIALKWNENTLRMQTAVNIQVSNETFIARGIDWILTQNSFIQVLDESPFIFRQQVSFDDSFSVSAFYSFLPASSGWQIINGFLIRRYGNEASNALYSLSVPAGLYLTHKDNAIWGKDGLYIGIASITGNDNYSLEIAQTHSLSDNISGLAFIGEDIYGFQQKQDSSLCPVSSNCKLYLPDSGQWQNVFNDNDNQGNIYFDPFNYAAIAVRDNQVNLLPEKKIFQAKGIAQWVVPTRNIASVTSDFVIAQLEHDILATHVNSGLYREFLHEKKLALSSSVYSGNKLAIGTAGNALTFNSIQVEQEEKPDVEIILLNVFSTDNNVDFCRIYSNFSETYSSVSGRFNFCSPIFELTAERQYTFLIVKYTTVVIDGEEYDYWDEYLEASSTRPVRPDWDPYDWRWNFWVWFIDNFKTTMAYINPDTGEINFFDVSIAPQNNIIFTTDPDSSRRFIDTDNSRILMDYVHFHGSYFDIVDSRIFYEGSFTNKSNTEYFPVATIPEEIASYIPNLEINSAEQNAVYLDYFYLENQKIIQSSSWSSLEINSSSIQSPTYAYFKDNRTGNYFTYDIAPILRTILVQSREYEIKIFSFPDWSSLTGDSINPFCKITMHAIVFLDIIDIGYSPRDTYDWLNIPSKVIFFKTIVHS